MKNDKFISFLGLAKRSGNLFLGFDTVKHNIINKNNILLILISNDTSENTLKKINSISSKYNIKTVNINYSMDNINLSLGKYTGIIGISNTNFIVKINELLFLLK